jgi:hypothetical protein
MTWPIAAPRAAAHYLHSPRLRRETLSVEKRARRANAQIYDGSTKGSGRGFKVPFFIGRQSGEQKAYSPHRLVIIHFLMSAQVNLRAGCPLFARAPRQEMRPGAQFVEYEFSFAGRRAPQSEMKTIPEHTYIHMYTHTVCNSHTYTQRAPFLIPSVAVAAWWRCNNYYY